MPGSLEPREMQRVLAAVGAARRRIAILAELAVAQLGLRATLGVLDPRAEFGGETGT